MKHKCVIMEAVCYQSAMHYVHISYIYVYGIMCPYIPKVRGLATAQQTEFEIVI